MVRRWYNLLRRSILPQFGRNQFDPVYYVRRYPDLSVLESTHAARRHYEQHGRKEGRYPNAAVESDTLYHQYLSPSDEFDLRAYKALNPDLRAFFDSDREYIIHYIRHGKSEGRQSTFDATDADDSIPGPVWAPLLSVSQFIAWASEWLPKVPENRREAVNMFEHYGIAKLAPLRFDLLFDPIFYRHHYTKGTQYDDVELYRRWLYGGEQRNEAPNEDQFLLPYIGQFPFPERFDWRSYAAAVPLPATCDRAEALRWLFDAERGLSRIVKYINADDFQAIEHVVRYRVNHGRLSDADFLLSSWRQTASSWPPSLWSLQGDIDIRLGRVEQAKEAFVQALSKGDQSFHPVDQVAQMHIGRGNPERAVAWLQEQRGNWRGSAAFDQLTATSVNQWFEKLSADGHKILSACDDLRGGAPAVAKFNDQMLAGLAAIAEAIEALEEEPGRLQSSEAGHVVFLGNEDLRQCTHYRIEQKQEQFARAGIEFRRHDSRQIDAFMTDLPNARAAIFYRVPATPDTMRAIIIARRMGIPTYYEIDDLIFDPAHYPPPYESFLERISPSEYNGLRFGVPLFQFALSLCDKAIASTPVLLKHMADFTCRGTGLVARNGLDSRNRSSNELAARVGLNETDRVRIFYGSGTLAHNSDFVDLACPALLRLLEERSEIDLVLIGHVTLPEAFNRFCDRILYLPPTAAIQEYWSILAACDINLAVLKIDPAADCKSEIKWLEAAILGIPSVVSGTITYREVISSGKDGLIADDPEQWYRYLGMLVRDPALRRAIGEAARAKALADYSLEAGAAIWKEEFCRPLHLPATRPPKRLRVLVCNVFFAPQSIGGATRVVEDNVAWISKNCPDVELAVFCSDEGASPSGRLRTSQFGDVPVFRLAVAAGPAGDSEIFADRNVPAFHKVIDAFRPDIIHFHCIQRLGASIVRAAKDQGIPYIITLHDGWWLSPNQFFVDRDGLLHMPSVDRLADFSSHRSATIASLCRRHTLEPLLQGAGYVLAVSQTFADIYRSCGVISVKTLTNGLPDLPAPTRLKANNGPLRLAHIGGRSSHKGADLVEAALRRGHYPNFHLLMIDGHLTAGSRINTLWGQTPVTLSAPVEQAAIGQLYEEIDVLLAPSRWPESYGLVAREASHFGVWVVASRLGAMGEDVIEKQNGFLIDTKDRTDLDRVLTELHNEIDFYRDAPAVTKTIRKSADQSDQLVSIYRMIHNKYHQ